MRLNLIPSSRSETAGKMGCGGVARHQSGQGMRCTLCWLGLSAALLSRHCCVVPSGWACVDIPCVLLLCSCLIIVLAGTTTCACMRVCVLQARGRGEVCCSPSCSCVMGVVTAALLSAQRGEREVTRDKVLMQSIDWSVMPRWQLSIAALLSFWNTFC